LREFAQWWTTNKHEEMEEMARKSIPEFSETLREYALQMFELGKPRRDLAESINALVDRYPWIRSSLSGPWKVVTAWENLCPTQHHPPMPLEVLQAMVAMSLAWGWEDVALLLLVSFFMLLRPSEAILATPANFLLNSAMQAALLLGIQDPKTQRRGARQQYAKLDVGIVCTYVRARLMKMPRSERLWQFSNATFATRMRRLLISLGLDPVFTPGSLRTGGATHLFHISNEDVMKLMWRGRWSSIRMLSHYIQELSVESIRHQSTTPLVHRLSSLFDKLLT